VWRRRWDFLWFRPNEWQEEMSGKGPCWRKGRAIKPRKMLSAGKQLEGVFDRCQKPPKNGKGGESKPCVCQALEGEYAARPGKSESGVHEGSQAARQRKKRRRGCPPPLERKKGKNVTIVTCWGNDGVGFMGFFAKERRRKLRRWFFRKRGELASPAHSRIKKLEVSGKLGF